MSVLSQFFDPPTWVRVALVLICVIVAEAVIWYRQVLKSEALYRFAKLKAREALYRMEYWNGGNIYVDPANYREAALRQFAKLEESVLAGDFSVAVDILAIKDIVMDHAASLDSEERRDDLQYRLTVLVRKVNRHLEAAGKNIGIKED